MRIATIPAFNPGPMTGAGTNTYLLGEAECVLIDAGVGDPRHLDAIAAELDRLGARLARLVVTHAHIDHIGGAAAIAARWPEAALVKIPWPDRDATYGCAWTPLADGDRIGVGRDELHVVHTPGHAPDHAALWAPSLRGVFSGDLVTPGTTVVIPGSRGGDLTAYLASLARLRALEAAVLYPGHGDPIADPRAIIDAYIAHRRERDAQILDALREGASTVEAVVRRVYPALRDDLRWAAEESVLAHLHKLSREGRATAAADGWTATPTYT